MTETSHTISPWRLDRSITLGVILALTLQTAGALMWTGAANERLDQLETRADATAPVARARVNCESTGVALMMLMDMTSTP